MAIADMRSAVGRADLLFITLDTLRFDVAAAMHAEGKTPALSALLGPEGWERRHSPATFTYAAHQAFFAGFLPTPVESGRHPRLFASTFEGSETTAPQTFTFEEPEIVSALSARGYRTICVGGVGFFNQRNALGSVLPGLFDESHWSPELGVTQIDSPVRQVDLSLHRVRALPPEKRVFLFLNVAALHQPNRMYVPGAQEDSVETQAGALCAVDRQLGRLFEGLRARGPWFGVICSDHGTAYGEGGHVGHRFAHPVIWEVPYAEVQF